ncbi:MAG TPA: DUF1512 domain-containing protein [Thermoprotei archaeon]|nr:DUF1512 domain-containing protein [Thermoprotei archaeon]
MSTSGLLPSSTTGWIIYLLVTVAWIYLMFYGQKLQSMIWKSQIESFLREMKAVSDAATAKLINAVVQRGKPNMDPSQRIKDFLEFFTIEPVDRDPSGVLKRLEYLLDVRENRFDQEMAKLAPNASSEEQANLAVAMEAAMALNFIYRYIRHYLVLGTKQNNWMILMQVAMSLGQIKEIARSYEKAMNAFLDGKPIGDGAGPMVAHMLAAGAPMQEIEGTKTVFAKQEFEGRTLFILKAKGPGGRVGKPGEGVQRLIESEGDKVKLIITVDAALKLEGDNSGEIVEGVGAAIGDPGPEKFKIEEAARTHNVPLLAVILKESMDEAITSMKKEIADAVPAAVEKVKQVIREQTKTGDEVIVAGIGNSIGVA